MRNPRPIIIAILLSLFLAAAATPTRVYLLPLDDEIGSSTWHNTSRAIAEAGQQRCDLLVVHLNTYGGSVLHADSIRTALLHCPVPTVAFVDNNAASAGALIALSCDSVYMRRDATMGAVTVINGTDGAAMPDKYQSYMRAMMRATAESHGRDSLGKWRRSPLVAEAMVDPRVSVPGLIDSTRVLTFTAGEAVKWHFADGTAESLDEVLGNLGIDDYTVSRFEPTWVDILTGFLTNPAVQGILIMLIIGGIYFELQTPGMGFPSVVAVMAAVLYFLPLCLTGIASSWLIILFAIGILLLLLEIFVIPGFGVTGISGLVCMGAAIFIGLLENFSYVPGKVDIHSVFSATVTFVLAIALSIGLILLLSSRYAPKGLRIGAELTHCQDIDKGYIGVDTTPSHLVGQEAFALTDMRPGGKIECGGESYDAVSTRGFIDAGAAVKIIRFAGAQLYVEPVRSLY